ncbi:MAG: hypothetical protein AB7U43_00650 [Desulfobacter sp.]
MKNHTKPIVRPASERRLPYMPFENTNTLLHQAMNVLQDVHDEYDDTIRVKLPRVPPEPTLEGRRRMKLDRLMNNVVAHINSGKIDCARNLYHYFVDEFRQEMQPNLDLPALSVSQQHLDLPPQDLLITIINSAKVAEQYHAKGLSSGWDDLDFSVQLDVMKSVAELLASLELTKLGAIRLNQLANLITNTGGWQEGRSSERRAWTQAEVDEAVSIVVKRDDCVSLLMRFEYFLKRCFPSIIMPHWERPSSIMEMTEEEILTELYADLRNDYLIISGIRGIVSISRQRPMTQEEMLAQYHRQWRPYGLKLQEIINTYVDQNAPPDQKLQQLRVAVTTSYQYAQKDVDEEQLMLISRLAKLLQYRSDLTWEDIEQKTVSEKSAT